MKDIITSLMKYIITGLTKHRLGDAHSMMGQTTHITYCRTDNTYHSLQDRQHILLTAGQTTNAGKRPDSNIHSYVPDNIIILFQKLKHHV